MGDTMIQSVGTSLKRFFRNFPYILLLLLLISVPINLIQACVVDVSLTQDGALNLSEDYLSDTLSKYLVYLFLSFVLTSVLNMLYIGVLLILKQDRDGEPVNFRSVFEHAFMLLPKVWLTQILSGLLIGIGLMFFVLPGIILYYIFYMVPFAVVYTEEWGRKGLQAASRYTRKYGRKVVGIILFDLAYRFVIALGTGVLLDMVPFVGRLQTVFSVGVYCLQDLLLCVSFAIIGGWALSMPIDVGQEENKADTHEMV